MTREELIRNLKYTMEKHKNDKLSTFDTNILAMCKDILDYLEQETYEDAISRQAVNTLLDELARRISDERCFTFRGRSPEAIMMDILSLPSVTPQKKIGHWKGFIHSAYHDTDEYGEPIWREVTIYHCSQCNRRTVIKEKFCPNCGAKMESEDK